MLDQVVMPTERVFVVARAYRVHNGLPSLGTRLLAVTSSRLLCVRRSFGLARTLDIPLAGIKSVEVSGSIGAAILVIRTGQGKVRFNMPKALAQQMELTLDRLRNGHHQLSGGPYAVDARPDGIADRSDVEALRSMVEHLETDMARLQQQVDFLEQLMRKQNA